MFAGYTHVSVLTSSCPNFLRAPHSFSQMATSCIKKSSTNVIIIIIIIIIIY
jgi:hypothetical protein